MTNPANNGNGRSIFAERDDQIGSKRDLSTNKEDIFEYNSKKGFIIPPGMIDKMYEFHSLIETAEGKPILITGPTGVGKSLFIHMYCEWYKKRKGAESKIIVLNCSHFEKAFARSELFGHAKGSFTGAAHDHNGWIEKANGGLLVLDEIGELPDECQAQLLTFMEDRKYHRVGESVIRQAKDLQIIGATNREWENPGKQLRDDLWNRFLTISIPPLYSRRNDVLYYVAEKSPELIRDLSLSDILSLLAYNWPGNVREIHRVVSVLKARHYLRKINPIIRWSELEIPNFFSLPKEQTNLSDSLVSILNNNLETNGVDVKSLNHMLNSYGIGLSDENAKVAFKDFEEQDLYGVKKEDNPISFDDLASVEFAPRGPDYMQADQQRYESIKNQVLGAYQNFFNVKIFSEYRPFYCAQMGYELFCWFFLQDRNTYRNVFTEVLSRRISVRAEYTFRIVYQKTMTQEEKNKDRALLETLSKQTFEFMKGGMRLEKIDMSEPYNDEKLRFILQLRDTYYDDEDLYTTIQLEQQAKQKDEVDIFSMTRKDFEKYYYEGLLKRYPTTRKIAEILDVKEQTLYSKLRSLRKENVIS